MWHLSCLSLKSHVCDMIGPHLWNKYVFVFNAMEALKYIFETKDVYVFYKLNFNLSSNNCLWQNSVLAMFYLSCALTWNNTGIQTLETGRRRNGSPTAAPGTPGEGVVLDLPCLECCRCGWKHMPRRFETRGVWNYLPYMAECVSHSTGHCHNVQGIIEGFPQSLGIFHV